MDEAGEEDGFDEEDDEHEESADEFEGGGGVGRADFSGWGGDGGHWGKLTFRLWKWQ